MRKRIKQITILICMATFLAVAAAHYSYRQLMDDVHIAQYFNSVADNLDWQTVYIRAIVPEDRFKGGWTFNAIRAYVIIRSRNIPNRIDIVLYDNAEKMWDCEEYAEISFQK